MIQLVQWPPQQYTSFSVRGRLFEWKENEPFVSLMKDGTIDTDPKRLTPGFVNRVQRYGRQNGFNESEWELQQIYFAILQRIPLPLRSKFFKNTPSDFRTPLEDVKIHPAPVPSGFAKAAKPYAVEDQDPELPLKLARLTPDEWLALLKRWLLDDQKTRKATDVAGPAWWWAGHSVSKNPTDKTTPMHFVGLWLGTFPCRKCRISARRYIARHPIPDWAGFEGWMNTLHNHVNASKKPVLEIR